MSSEASVYLKLGGADNLVGSAFFSQRRGGPISTTFRYEQSWLTRRGAFAIDPELPLVSGLLATPHRLPGAFSDCSPDRWGRRLVSKRSIHRQLTEVDFLLGVSDESRQGALRFKVPGNDEFQHPDSAVPRMVELPELLRAADAVTRDPDDRAAIKTLLDAGTGSLGGARPKASIRDGERLLIAKFPNIADDEWDVMAWEKTALDLAALCGIVVPTSRLITIDERHILLLDRFDRHGDGSRIPYLSAMTLAHGTDGGANDYDDLIEPLEEQGSRVSRDLAELWNRVAFSVLVHNTDDHLRNHGFLRASPAGWSLSPAFDINPDPELRAARVTAIFGATTVDQEVDGLLLLAEACRLTSEAALTRLGVLASALASSWEGVARRSGIMDTEIRQFAPIFERAAGFAA
ncbi:MAG TPA: type II toxin-antitoxin system HipA family toxin [Galbitalea sp.]|jgi:serine/threonine-protein kinase HipA